MEVYRTMELSFCPCRLDFIQFSSCTNRYNFCVEICVGELLLCCGVLCGLSSVRCQFTMCPNVLACRIHLSCPKLGMTKSSMESSHWYTTLIHGWIRYFVTVFVAKITLSKFGFLHLNISWVCFRSFTRFVSEKLRKCHVRSCSPLEWRMFFIWNLFTCVQLHFGCHEEFEWVHLAVTAASWLTTNRRHLWESVKLVEPLKLFLSSFTWILHFTLHITFTLFWENDHSIVGRFYSCTCTKVQKCTKSHICVTYSCCCTRRKWADNAWPEKQTRADPRSGQRVSTPLGAANFYVQQICSRTDAKFRGKVFCQGSERETWGLVTPTGSTLGTRTLSVLALCRHCTESTITMSVVKIICWFLNPRFSTIRRLDPVTIVRVSVHLCRVRSQHSAVRLRDFSASLSYLKVSNSSSREQCPNPGSHPNFQMIRLWKQNSSERRLLVATSATYLVWSGPLRRARCKSGILSRALNTPCNVQLWAWFVHWVLCSLNKFPIHWPLLRSRSSSGLRSPSSCISFSPPPTIVHCVITHSRSWVCFDLKMKNTHLGNLFPKCCSDALSSVLLCHVQILQKWGPSFECGVNEEIQRVANDCLSVGWNENTDLSSNCSDCWTNMKFCPARFCFDAKKNVILICSHLVHQISQRRDICRMIVFQNHLLSKLSREQSDLECALRSNIAWSDTQVTYLLSALTQTLSSMLSNTASSWKKQIFETPPQIGVSKKVDCNFALWCNRFPPVTWNHKYLLWRGRTFNNAMRLYLGTRQLVTWMSRMMSAQSSSRASRNVKLSILTNHSSQLASFEGRSQTSFTKFGARAFTSVFSVQVVSYFVHVSWQWPRAKCEH